MPLSVEKIKKEVADAYDSQSNIMEHMQNMERFEYYDPEIDDLDEDGEIKKKNKNKNKNKKELIISLLKAECYWNKNLRFYRIVDDIWNNMKAMFYLEKVLTANYLEEYFILYAESLGYKLTYAKEKEVTKQQKEELEENSEKKNNKKIDDFNKCRIINFNECLGLQNKIKGSLASEEEKLEVDKYFFLNNFKEKDLPSINGRIYLECEKKFRLIIHSRFELSEFEDCWKDIIERDFLKDPFEGKLLFGKLCLIRIICQNLGLKNTFDETIISKEKLKNCC